jgi:general secretion pathway protein A
MLYMFLGGLLLLLGGALAAFEYQKGQLVTKVATAQAPIVKHNTPLQSVTQPNTSFVSADSKPLALLPATLSFPADEPRSRSRALAYSALFQEWRADYREGVDPCHQAENLGLRCRTTRGGLEELRQLNIPAVLYLLDDQGQTFYAALTKLEGESATFVTGTEIRKVSLDALASQWSGNYTVLLHLPLKAQDGILFGAHGPAVQWLRKNLAQAQGWAAKTTAIAILDDDLKNHIKQFQLSQGLIPDGAAGPQTLARLSAMTDQSAPRLSHQQVRQ